MTDELEGMTQARWNALSKGERSALVDNSQLSPQLIGLEGWRVVACDVGSSDATPVYRRQVDGMAAYSIWSCQTIGARSVVVKPLRNTRRSISLKRCADGLVSCPATRFDLRSAG